jgi:hypothetical protein
LNLLFCRSSYYDNVSWNRKVNFLAILCYFLVSLERRHRHTCSADSKTCSVKPCLHYNIFWSSRPCFFLLLLAAPVLVRLFQGWKRQIRHTLSNFLDIVKWEECKGAFTRPTLSKKPISKTKVNTLDLSPIHQCSASENNLLCMHLYINCFRLKKIS